MIEELSGLSLKGNNQCSYLAKDKKFVNKIYLEVATEEMAQQRTYHMDVPGS